MERVLAHGTGAVLVQKKQLGVVVKYRPFDVPFCRSFDHLMAITVEEPPEGASAEAVTSQVTSQSDDVAREAAEISKEIGSSGWIRTSNPPVNRRIPTELWSDLQHD
jgi:hypothetical protein